MSTLLATTAGTETAPSPSGGRISALDGWRGVAVLLVLTEHVQSGLYSSFPWTGMIAQHGVTIFFVLSGYLITRKLCDEWRSTGTIQLRRFYLRRFFRLLPVAWVYLFLICIVTRHTVVAVDRRAIFGCLFFFRNYLAGGCERIYTAHFWSLSLEEQFYLVWPGLLLFLQIRRSTIFTLVAIAALIAGYRYIHWESLVETPIWETFKSQYRADSLLIGCAAALALPDNPKYLRTWMVWPLLCLLIFCIHRYNALIPAWECVVVAILIHLTAGHTEFMLKKILASRPFAFLGLISYSLYVWQQPFTEAPIPSVNQVPLRLILIFGIAAVSFYCLERPLIRFGRKLERRTQSAASIGFTR